MVNAPCVTGLKTYPDNYFSAAALRSYRSRRPETVKLALKPLSFHAK